MSLDQELYNRGIDAITTKTPDSSSSNMLDDGSDGDSGDTRAFQDLESDLRKFGSGPFSSEQSGSGWSTDFGGLSSGNGQLFGRGKPFFGDADINSNPLSRVLNGRENRHYPFTSDFGSLKSLSEDPSLKLPTNKNGIAMPFDPDQAADWLSTHNGGRWVNGAFKYGQCRMYVLEAMGSFGNILSSAANTVGGGIGANAVFHVLQTNAKVPGTSTRFKDLFEVVATGYGDKLDLQYGNYKPKKGDSSWWEGAEFGHASMATKDGENIKDGNWKFDMPGTSASFSSWSGLKNAPSHGYFVIVRPKKFDTKPVVSVDANLIEKPQIGSAKDQPAAKFSPGMHV